VFCFVLFPGWILPALGQISSESSSPDIVRATALSRQEFHCHTGYPLAECQKDLLHLKEVLSRYPIEALGHWTWVLVRSQDWKPISRMLQLNPVSPAFTALDPRETFLEEALFVHDPERTSELMEEWHCSMPKLLELAVSHELGHAYCDESNEEFASRFGEDLKKGLMPRCRVAKRAHKDSVAGERQRVQPTPSRGPGIESASR
jgi:hypothetical protein